MTRISLVAPKQTIAVLIFIAASVVAVYSQQLKTSSPAQTATGTSAQTNAELKQSNTDSSAVAENSGQLDSNQPSAQQPTNQVYTFPTNEERFNRYVKSTVGPFSLARTAISAGIDQWSDHPDEWEQGASGFGKRYASRFGQTAIQQTVIYGLDSALGLDTGFRRSNRTGFFPRLKHALAENITSRARTGKRVISVPRITGVYTGKIISAETWYPERYSYKDGLRSGTQSLITGFGINLIREFLISW